jgi:hypothetical protein
VTLDTLRDLAAMPPDCMTLTDQHRALAALPLLVAVAAAVAMMPTPVSLSGTCTFCDAVMDAVTTDGFWPHEGDCPLGMAHRAHVALDAL